MLKARYLFKFKYSLLCFALIGLSSLKASHVNSIGGLTAAIKGFTKNLDQYYKTQAYAQAQEVLSQNDFNLPNDASNLPDDNLFNLPNNDERRNVSCVKSVSFDISDLPCKPQKNSLKKIMNKAIPPVSLSFTTSLLIRLFFDRKEIFDVDGYHSLPVGLMYNMLQYGKMSLEHKKKINNQVYTAYGLLYSVKKVTKKNKIIEDKEVTQARIVTERTKYIDDVIFHFGFESFNKHKDNIKQAIGQKKYNQLNTNCLKLDFLLVPEEKNIIWRHVHSRKVKDKPLFIDVNCRVNTVPLSTMIKIYGPYFKKRLETVYNNKQDEVLVFPCPNKNFFVTTRSSITGASMVYA